MHPLSDVMRAVKLDGAYFYMLEAGSPWSVCSAPARELVPVALSGAEHLISCHVLLSGVCWVGLDGERDVRMQPGDVVVFPRGDRHLMSSAEGMRSPATSAIADADWHSGTVRLGPESTCDTTIVSGFLGCDGRALDPLLASLPRRLHARGMATGWLSHFPREAVAESRARRVGSETVLTRMAELMFVEVVRHHFEMTPAPDAGWLAGLTDDIVGTALAKLHERPAHAWTLAELAHESTTSRTVLVDRFSRLVGQPPMTYLKRWRLHLAAEQLAAGSAKVSAIGTRVGYDSDAAFSRAFKRETGMSPAAWRRARAVKAILSAAAME